MDKRTHQRVKSGTSKKISRSNDGEKLGRNSNSFNPLEKQNPKTKIIRHNFSNNKSPTPLSQLSRELEGIFNIASQGQGDGRGVMDGTTEQRKIFLVNEEYKSVYIGYGFEDIPIHTAINRAVARGLVDSVRIDYHGPPNKLTPYFDKFSDEAMYLIQNHPSYRFQYHRS